MQNVQSFGFGCMALNLVLEPLTISPFYIKVKKRGFRETRVTIWDASSVSSWGATSPELHDLPCGKGTSSSPWNRR